MRRVTIVLFKKVIVTETDWADDEPDISIGGTESESEQEEAKAPASSTVSELLRGRIIRKATAPATPIAPKKPKFNIAKAESERRNEATVQPSTSNETVSDKILSKDTVKTCTAKEKE